jgi:hypothetical protein
MNFDRDNVRTIMVKAAPRFATILCLCYVRARCLRVRSVDSTSGLAAAMHVSIRIEGIAVAEGTRTLAMPMGDADSAMALMCG